METKFTVVYGEYSNNGVHVRRTAISESDLKEQIKSSNIKEDDFIINLTTGEMISVINYLKSKLK